MDYSVTCGCGKVRKVTAGDAGSSLTCSCGLQVEVPLLSVLRREAGQFSGAPELIIESMISNNELPQGSSCVECHNETDGMRNFLVVCESAASKNEVGWGALFFLFLFGWVGILVATILDRRVSEPLGAT